MKIKYLLICVVLCFGTLVKGQSPNLVKFSTTNSDGTFYTGDQIRLTAEFDNWLGLNSTVRVRLNTGDTITMTFDPKIAEDFLDPAWGEPGKRNATLGSHFRTYGVYCIKELDKHPDTKGWFALSGGFNNYEETGKNDFVITDHDGKLLQGFDFNEQVFWVEETRDGGLIAGGKFINYGGNSQYDYIVKFKFDEASQQFVVDTDFMNNLTHNNTQVALDGVISEELNTYGKPQRGVLQDTDGNIFIIGEFDNVGGVQRPTIAKLNENGTLNTNFNFTATTYNGNTMSFDPDLDPLNQMWASANGSIYRIDKATGDVVNSKVLGISALAITVMPNSDVFDSEGHPGPGGILITGRAGTPTGGWFNIISLQDDLSVTPKNLFALGRNDQNPDGISVTYYSWAIDGAAFLKGKMWLGMHDASPYNSRGNYYEGGLIVLNYDGSLNKNFNDMLANRNNSDSYDGIGGFGSGGGTDIISLRVTSDDDLMVGGSYCSIMQYTDDAYGTYNYNANPDDQIIIRMNFRRAVGYYTPSANDMVPKLKIVEILDGNTIQGAFGESAGSISMSNIQSGNEFENNHFIGINIPYTREEEQFVTAWQTDSNNEAITIPTTGSGYDFFVDWGTTKDENGDGIPDGNIQEITHHTSANMTANPPTYTYPIAGNYTVKIMGGIDINGDGFSDGVGFPHIFFNNDGQDDVLIMNGNADKIRSVEQWGNIKWTSMVNAFWGCDNLQVNASDVPDLSGAVSVSLSRMFRDASSVNFDLSNWDISNINNVSEMFSGASMFNNGDTGNNGSKPLIWADKTANVENMSSMFYKAVAFNQSVNGWDVGKVTNMTSMFERTTLFNNGDIGDNSASPLNWNWSATIPAVTTVTGMFLDAVAFNQNISGFKVDNVTDFSFMFYGARKFNQPIDTWIVSRGRNFTSMFHYASIFNQFLGSWDTQEATNMARMFYQANAFNQDLSNWNISGLEEGAGVNTGGAANMLDYCGMSVENYDTLLTSWNIKYNNKINVKFGAADLMYCKAESSRKEMIDRGWGDGVYGDQPNDNPDGRIGTYLDIVDAGSVRITEVKLNNYHSQACLSTTIKLDSLIQYEPWAGQNIKWTKDGIAILNTYSTLGHMVGDVIALNYEVTETHCGIDITGNGTLYIEIANTISLENRSVKVCADEADNINLNTILGVAVEGTWTAITGNIDAQLRGSRFNGTEAFNNSTSDIAYQFMFTPQDGSCVINGTAIITVIITNEF